MDRASIDKIILEIEKKSREFAFPVPRTGLLLVVNKLNGCKIALFEKPKREATDCK
jgi:hypothetical protein